MSRGVTRTLVVILVLLVAAIIVNFPNSPGLNISLGSLKIQRSFDTKLGLDLVGGVQALLEADVPADQPVDAEAMNTARAIVENRVNGLGVNEAVVQQAGDRRILVEIPGEKDPDKALTVLQRTGLLEFVDFSDVPPSQAVAMEGTQIRTDFAQGSTSPVTATQTVTGTIYKTVMTGAMLKDAQATISQTGQFEVSFELTSEGAQIFKDYTSTHIGKVLAIVLDKTVISAPSINTAITEGRGVITGNFNRESANQLAVQLRYGSLPVPLKVASTQTVGPTLGQISLNQSLIAGVIGVIVVVLFMGLYYRLPGIVADLALLVYALLSLALFKLIPITLTLPGIAGFVLSMGVAVDANVLIFERMKEELRSGKTLRQAIDQGWSRAWPSIRDSNISTLITCAILFWFGSTFGASIVKGFSLTLAIGVAVSMFTAIIVTRTFLHLILDRIQISQHESMFGV